MSNTKTEAQRLAEFKDLEFWPAGVGLTDWVESVCAELRRLDALVAHLTADRDNVATELAARTEANRALEAENQQLKTSLALVQQHHATSWNRGHQAGLMAGASAVKQATDAVKADAWGNTQLTNALMQAEAERDQLRAQLAKAVAEEREACKRTCMDIHKRNESAFALECALAIEARSNT